MPVLFLNSEHKVRKRNIILATNEQNNCNFERESLKIVVLPTNGVFEFPIAFFNLSLVR
jgi:hypothetical protein